VQPQSRDVKAILRRETALFVGLLFAGFVLLPILIYVVGDAVFGSYGGAGFSHFFAALSDKIRHGDLVAWFLVLSPYIGIQCLRLVVFGWHAVERAP